MFLDIVTIISLVGVAILVFVSLSIILILPAEEDRIVQERIEQELEIKELANETRQATMGQVFVAKENEITKEALKTKKETV